MTFEVCKKVLINLLFLCNCCSVLYNQGELFAAISVLTRKWILVTLKYVGGGVGD